MEKRHIAWTNAQAIPSRAYTCSYCGHPIASNLGYIGQFATKFPTYVYICHYCSSPTFVDPSGIQTPGASFGNPVADVPAKEVSALYDEARQCMSVAAYTASVLCSRKLIMNIAVSKQAKEGLSFVEYVSFLSEKGFLPPDGKEWVDHIRKKGNEATHEVKIMPKEDAEELLVFLEMLLKFIYEFPATIRKRTGPTN